MKKNYMNLFKLPCLITAALLVGAPKVEAQTTLTFAYTGSMQTFTVPSCVASVTIVAAGARGVGTTAPYVWAPGNGGWAKGILSVTGGQVLNIFVGGTNGYNGGGTGLLGANGGGASDVRVGGTLVGNRVIVAGGGGGAGGDNWGCMTGAGHGGGGTAVGSNFVGGEGGGGYTSGTGCGTNGGNSGGVGGTGTHGGGGGGGGFISGGGGATGLGTAPSGALGIGGDAYNSAGCASYGTGGGGGGYYGGGGAAGNNCGAGRGGGGSSWTGTLGSPSFTAGTNAGNGVIYLTYDFGVPTLTISSTSPSNVCQGTTMTLTATGASTYTWSTLQTGSVIVVSPTVNTTYSVANQGTAACPFYGLFPTTMIQWPNITATASPNYIICPQTPILLTAGGAHIYSWSNGVINGVTFPASSTTIYTVTGTSTITGCSNTTTVMVPVYISTVAVSAPTSVCAGSQVNISVSGAMSQTWTPGNSTFPVVGVSPAATTVYTVNATTSDFCPASNTTTVTVNPSPTVTASASRPEICKTESSVLTAVGAGTYSWSAGGSASSVTITPQTSGYYYVTGTTNNCSQTATVYVKVSFCVGVDEATNTGNTMLSVYPNPSNGEFNVNGETSMNLNLVNELGQVIKVVTLTKDNNYKSHISDLPNGIYFLVGTGSDTRVNYKLVVNK